MTHRRCARVKRILIRLLWGAGILPLLLAAGGCWDRVDINNLAVVQMISIDRSPSGDISVGVQIVIPADAGGGGTSGPSGGNGALRPVYTLTGVGTTLVEAFTSLQTKTARRLFFGNVQIVAIGEDYARHGILPLLDAFSRQLQLREAVDIVCTQGSALKLLQARTRIEAFPGAALRALIGLRVIPEMSVLRLDLEVYHKGADPAVPWIEINTLTDALDGSQTADSGSRGTTKETDLPAQKEEFRLAGVGLFSGDRLVGYMSLHVARPLGWLTGAGNSSFVKVDWPPDNQPPKPLTPAPSGATLRPGEGLVETPTEPGHGQPGAYALVMHMIRGSVRWNHIKVQGDRVSVDLNFIGESNIEENPGGVNLTDIKTLKAAEDETDEVVITHIKALLEQAQQADSDVLRLGRIIARADPKDWSRIRERWPEVFPKVVVHIHSDVKIRRYGFAAHVIPQHTWQVLEGGPNI